VDGVAFDYAATGWGSLGDDGAYGDGLGRGCGVGWGLRGWGLRHSGCGGRWGGWCGGEVEVFGAGDVEADVGDAGGGGSEREAGEGGHDVGGSGGGFGIAEEEADSGAVDAGGVGGGGLGDDAAGFAGVGDMGDDTEVEAEAANVDGGGAFALADNAGDGDLLCAEAFGDADGPLAADGGAGGGGLGEDAAGGRAGGVKTVFEVEAEAAGAGLAAGVGDGEAGEVGYGDLAAVDGETHGDEGGDEGDHEHGQGSEEDVEEAVDGGDLHCLCQDTGWLRVTAGGWSEGARLLERVCCC